MKKEEIEENKTHVFKYVDIGNTEKELGEIQEYEEDILLNLPSRAKMKAKQNDILLPRPIGSTQGIVKVSSEFDNQLFTTGNIQIRPKNEDESFLLWTMLRSDIMQKQFFYLQSGCSQPEISPNNFEEHVLIPFPKGKIRHELILKSKEYYREALKHKKEIVKLQNDMINYFEKEIRRNL
jgi:type I restriction enzyme M protein